MLTKVPIESNLNRVGDWRSLDADEWHEPGRAADGRICRVWFTPF
jgi:hypothetical protein